MRIDFFGKTDRGQVRRSNEDFFSGEKVKEREYLFVVADGMGGHRAGDVAGAATQHPSRRGGRHLLQRVAGLRRVLGGGRGDGNLSPTRLRVAVAGDAGHGRL